MEIDEAKIDEAVLALLWLNHHATGMAWKGFDWQAMGRLHERDMISNPAKKAKSVWLSEDGLAEGERLFRALFSR
jgi:Domain of unknown function (DUF6429)